MARRGLTYIPCFFYEIFLSADIYRLCKLGQWTIKILSPFFYFELGGHLGWKSGSTDTILEGGHPRIFSAKFD
jgi:hypothetical protein